ncbi:MAG: type VI lipase adapter Tla3 domain-containing protein [Janthinobacterium lividum]
MKNKELHSRAGTGMYVISAALTLAVLIPIWTVFVMTVIEPTSLTVREQTMGNRFFWWVLGPVVLVVTLFGTHWVKASKNERPAQRGETLQAAGPSEQQKREYVLEVIGLGVTLDKYRQGKLWEALLAGSPHTTIREQDPKKYPWSALDKDGISGGRGGDTLENGASFTPMYFAVPVFNAEPEAHNEGRADTPESPTPGLAGGAIGAGMAWHLFVVGPRRFGEQPDRILEDVFAFFDAHPDVPYIVLNSEDSLGTRDSNSPPDSPFLLRDGNYVTEKPDASALFVLARRERVDPARPFVWDDPDNDFVQNEFRWMYGNMRAAVPNSMRKRALQTPTQIGADPI